MCYLHVGAVTLHICFSSFSVYSFELSTLRVTLFTDIFQKLVYAVQRMRGSTPGYDPANQSFAGLRPMSMFGLNHHSMRYMLEQMPGVSRCCKYHFIHHTQKPAVLVSCYLYVYRVCEALSHSTKCDLGQYGSEIGTCLK